MIHSKLYPEGHYIYGPQDDEPIGVTAERLCDMAKRMGRFCECSFNGVYLEAGVGTKPEDVVRLYAAAITLAVKETSASTPSEPPADTPTK